jgi:CRISPR-associated protein Cmr2
MEYTILTISIGPVGAFIAAGRRSRDLWWGSRWLSACVKHVAQRLREENHRVLLPRLELNPITVANKIVIRLGSDDDPRVTVQKAEGWARDWLIEKITFSSTDGGKGLPSFVDRKRFDDQVGAIRTGDFIEFRAGWSAAPTFHEALTLASEHRDAAPRFFSASASEEGVPKCHLDPGRDSVMIGGDEVKGHSLAERVKSFVLEGEQLDAIYLARRRALLTDTDHLGKLPFPPVGRVAVDPWLGGVNLVASDLLVSLRRSLEAIFSPDAHARAFALSSPVDHRGGRDGDWTAPLPFDASFLAEGRLEAVQRVWDRLTPDRSTPEQERLADKAAQEACSKVVSAASRIHKEAGFPIPYYAMVEMDGDEVGSALQAITEEDEWSEVIKSLYQFSDGAEEIIRSHHGVPFYAAADELLFYIPVDKALPAVQELAAYWRETVGQTKGATDLSQTSLSAGIAIVHLMDDLDRVRKEASDALGMAKKARRDTLNGVTGGSRLKGIPFARVVECPRSGASRGASGPLFTLAQSLWLWQEAFGDGEESGLSLRTVGILQEHLQRFVSPSAKATDPLNPLLKQLLIEAIAGQHRVSSLGASDSPSALVTGALGEVSLPPHERTVDFKSITELLQYLVLEEGSHLSPESFARLRRSVFREALRKRLNACVRKRDVEALIAELLIAVRVQRIAQQRMKVSA